MGLWGAAVPCVESMAMLEPFFLFSFKGGSGGARWVRTMFAHGWGEGGGGGLRTLEIIKSCFRKPKLRSVCYLLTN